MALSVKLTAFEGPLDLLLTLIEKNKIDIYDIPIVEITNQYLEYIRNMEIQNMELASEFIIMAATLLDIKSRMLIPGDEESIQEDSDPRAELVRRLLEYKKNKYMSSILREQLNEAGVSLTKEMTLPEDVANYRPSADPAELLCNVRLEDLAAVYKDVLRRKADSADPVRSRFGKIEKERISVVERMISLEKEAIKSRTLSFGRFLESQSGRTNVVVTFLAVLELMHYGKIRVRQDELFGEIFIESLEDVSAVTDKSAFADSTLALI